MAKATYLISNHALNRTIERLVLSQNIKLNKKQVARNLKKARNIIIDDLNETFAYSNSKDNIYLYLYTNLNKHGLCRKYVISADTNNIVTVIDDIDIDLEAKKYNIIFDMKDKYIERKDKYSISKYVYATINNYKYLFVIDCTDDAICSFKMI